MVIPIPPWLSVTIGILCGVCSAYCVWDVREMRRHIKLLRGDSREEAIGKIRASVAAMRREYSIKPGDQFALQMLHACDQLEATMNKLERSEWQAVR